MARVEVALAPQNFPVALVAYRTFGAVAVVVRLAPMAKAQRAAFPLATVAVVVAVVEMVEQRLPRLLAMLGLTVAPAQVARRVDWVDKHPRRRTALPVRLQAAAAARGAIVSRRATAGMVVTGVVAAALVGRAWEL